MSLLDDELEFPLPVVHVPPCENKKCREYLTDVVSRLEERRVKCLHEYERFGVYREKYESKFKSSEFTIMHKCPYFWNKIKNIPCTNTSTGETKKIVCVSFLTSEYLSTVVQSEIKPPTEQATFRIFFDQLTISDISAEDECDKFVADIVSYISVEDTESNGDDYDNEDVNAEVQGACADWHPSPGRPRLPERTWRDPSVYQERNSHFYPNIRRRVNVKSIFRRSVWVEKEEEATPQQSMVIVPNLFGLVKSYGPKVYVRAECLAEAEDDLKEINSIVSYEKLRDEVDSWTEISDMGKLIFMIHKGLPELYGNLHDVGLAHIATCNKHQLSDRALTLLELLVIEELNAKSMKGRTSLNDADKLLVDSVCKMRQEYGELEDSKVYFSIQRLCNILLMRRCEAFDSSQEDGEDIFETFYQGLKSLPTGLKEKLKQNKADKWLSTTKDILQKFSKSTKSEILQFMSSEHAPHRQAEALMGKSKVTQVIVTFKLLRKVFTSKNAKDLNLLKECFRMKRKKLPEICRSMVIRGLALFLCHGLRSADNMNITPICEAAIEILNDAAGIDDISEIDDVLSVLVFENAPVIRKGIMTLLKKRKLYDKRQAELLRLETERLLCPLLCIKYDEEIPNTEGEWVHMSGSFKNRKVMVILHKPTERNHWFHNKTDWTAELDKMHLKQYSRLKSLQHPQIIELLAYHDSCVPQFYILEDFLKDNLQAVLENRNKSRRYFSPRSLYKFLVEIADAVEFCHSKGIVHRNITAESVFVVGTEDDGAQVKLAGFQLAMNLNGSDEIVVVEDAFALATRWLSPESLTRYRFSKATDVWMFGHFMYEVLTHGALPYSHVDKTDEALVRLIRRQDVTVPPEGIQLLQEKCIKIAHFNSIKACLSESSKRPSIGELKDSLDRKYRETSASSADDQPKYPELTDIAGTTRTPSSKHGKGIPDIHSITNCIKLPEAAIVNSRGYLNTAQQTTYTQYKLGSGYIFREEVKRSFSKDMMEKISHGNLDHVIPWHYFFAVEDNKSIIECHVRSAQLLDFGHVTVTRTLGGKLERYLHVLRHVAEQLQQLHNESFVLGYFRASHFFLEQPYRNVKVHIVSLTHLNYITRESECQVKGELPEDPCIKARAAYEVRKRGLYSPASDVHLFGLLLCEVFFAYMDGRVPSEDQICKLEIRNEHKDHQVYNGFNGDDIYTQIMDLVEWCTTTDPRLRPTMAQVIQELQRLISRDEEASRTMTSETDPPESFDSLISSSSLSTDNTFTSSSSYDISAGSSQVPPSRRPSKTSLKVPYSPSKTPHNDIQQVAELRTSVALRNPSVSSSDSSLGTLPTIVKRPTSVAGSVPKKYSKYPDYREEQERTKNKHISDISRITDLNRTARPNLSRERRVRDTWHNTASREIVQPRESTNTPRNNPGDHTEVKQVVPSKYPKRRYANDRKDHTEPKQIVQQSMLRHSDSGDTHDHTGLQQSTSRVSDLSNGHTLAIKGSHHTQTKETVRSQAVVYRESTATETHSVSNRKVQPNAHMYKGNNRDSPEARHSRTMKHKDNSGYEEPIEFRDLTPGRGHVPGYDNNIEIKHSLSSSHSKSRLSNESEFNDHTEPKQAVQLRNHNHRPKSNRQRHSGDHFELRRGSPNQNSKHEHINDSEDEDATRPKQIVPTGDSADSGLQLSSFQFSDGSITEAKELFHQEDTCNRDEYVDAYTEILYTDTALISPNALQESSRTEYTSEESLDTVMGVNAYGYNRLAPFHFVDNHNYV